MNARSRPKSGPNRRAALAEGLLKAMNMAALERLGPRRYAFLGQAPAFYLDLFPFSAEGRPCDSPWEFSPMLDYFLGEAEEFFEDGSPEGLRNSGYWLETGSDGQDIPLMATARLVDETEIIVIHAAREDYAERTRILRQARSEILERQKVATALDKYREKALFDALTKVYSRGAFSDILKEKLDAQYSFTRRTNSQELAVLMLDIDHFKYVNDDFGHLTGDAVLIQLGEILRAALRNNDTPVRYGGEEFIIVAPNTSLKQSLALAEKLRLKVANHDFGLGRPLTISIGCAVHLPGEDPTAFINRADQALYEAKKAGRNRVYGRA